MGELGELFEKLFSRFGARAFSEYGVTGIVSVFAAYLVIVLVAKFLRHAFKRRGEFEVWFRQRGQVRSETIHSGVCAAFLLIVALAQWPYFTYVLLRVFICGSSAYIASRMYSQHRVPLAWLAGAIAVLYNPILPVRMARSDWQAVNLLTAVPFIAYSLYLNWGSLSQDRSRRLQKSRALVRAAAAICTRMKGRDTRVFGLVPTDSAMSDFFVVTTAINRTHAIAIAYEVELRLKSAWGISAASDSRNDGWILLDYTDFVVHIFLKEERAFYDIEGARKSAYLSGESCEDAPFAETAPTHEVELEDEEEDSVADAVDAEVVDIIVIAEPPQAASRTRRVRRNGKVG